MAVKKISKTYESFSAGDILVASATNPHYGVKVLKLVWLDSVNDERLVVQYGRVLDNKWIADKMYNGDADLSLYLASDLRSSYAGKWTPEPGVKAGDVLKDQRGLYYIVASTDMVWCLTSGTHAGLAYWKNDGKKFSQVETAGGGHFSRHIKMSTNY